MDKFLNKVLAVDGSYMIHRALKSPASQELITSKGIKSGGFYLFLKMLQKELSMAPSYYPIVCWDKGRSPRRLSLYPNYKHDADKKLSPVIPGSPDDEYIKWYIQTREDLIQFLNSVNIPSLLIPGTEGDDLIYMLKLVSNKCIVLSDDKDMIQMASENCKVRRPMNDVTIDVNSCEESYKYPQYIYHKAIIGDPSDNIPQVAKGVGGTSASQIAQIIAESGAFDLPEIKSVLENAITRTDLFKPALIKKIQAVVDNFKQFEINSQLMDFRYVDIPAEMQNIIESSICPIINSRGNIFESYKYLGKYEIKHIDPGMIQAQIAPYSNRVLLEGK